MKAILLMSTLFLMLACSENSDATSNNEQEITEIVSPTNNDNETIAEKQSSPDDLMIEEEIDLDQNVSTQEKKLDEKLTDASEKTSKILESIEEPTETMDEEAPLPNILPSKPNHDKWDAMLRKNVSSSGKVNYSGMKAESTELNAYVKYLESLVSQEGWTRNEKLAYWINLYNAATVQLIVKNYPVGSITDLSGGKPWDQNVVKVGTASYSLNDIENKIIRPKFKDGRIHFAVNCAAKSCPPLMNKAFTAESLNRQLEKQTKSFINGSSNVIAADKVEISKIFDWYKVDFSSGEVITFLNKYSTTPINDDAEISFKEYNWDLNK